MNDLNARKAREMGVKRVLSTDTHSLDQLNSIGLGLAVARRAWAEPSDLLDTLDFKRLLGWKARKQE